MTFSTTLSNRLAVLCVVWLVACQSQLRPAPAPPPAPPPPPRALGICDGVIRPASAVQDPKVVASFQTFSKSWIAKLRSASAAKKGAGSRKRILDAFETELRPTGSPKAPYVGILRYCEQTLSCTGAAEATCSHSRNGVVTELFRYQGGKWIY